MSITILGRLRGNSVCRVALNADLQDELNDYFNKLIHSYWQDKEIIEFDGRYSANNDEIMEISGFHLPESLSETIENPLSAEILDLSMNEDRLYAIVASLQDEESNNPIIFQTFDSRKLLSKRFSIIQSNMAYSKLNSPGLVIDNKIAAVYLNNSIFFSSFHNARRVLDLSYYYREATDEDLSSFAEIENIKVEDEQWFVENADTTIRKKVALLQRNKVIENLSIDEIERSSHGLGIQLQIEEGRNGAKYLVIPRNKAKVKETLRFIDEDYFEAPLTHRTCITNSKRYLSTD